VASSFGAERIARNQAEARALLPDWDDAQFAAFVAVGSRAYWLGFDTAAHARHARLVHAAERDGQALAVDTRADPQRDATEVTIHAADHPGLFAGLAGAFAVSGLSIVDAKIFTLSNGMALDAFWVQDPSGDPISNGRRAKLLVMIERAVSGARPPPDQLAKLKGKMPDRLRAFDVTPRVLIDNEASSTHTVIEINGRDRPGLLYDVTLALTELSLQIASAKISTYGHRAIDVFYVKDIFGLKIVEPAKHKRIRSALIAALAGDVAQKPPREKTKRAEAAE
jgi:[protein-PII] uridylyltransferase